MSQIDAAMAAAASGLRAQTVRMRIAAENIANANSTGDTPGADPYRRRMQVFEDYLDRETGVRKVRVSGARDDQSAFRTRFDPAHPAADSTGFVKTPNVDGLIEAMDVREAQRAYEANLNIIEAARTMNQRALDLLRR
jgi:flagellar basal-body rod protein FlgC